MGIRVWGKLGLLGLYTGFGVLVEIEASRDKYIHIYRVQGLGLIWSAGTRRWAAEACDCWVEGERQTPVA